ncbi:MAG: FAD-dependent oxidoreductase [Gammaproteobacteria bacterium]|nr:FAD-dependent oxidoreductase [Gammaproteobacteria bacterium]
MPGTAGDIRELDVLVVGGGIAGLWVLERLVRRGFAAALVEQDRLGSGQTIAAQGMIHGGLKYALGGRLTRASATVATMPARWRACLEGRGEVDLRTARLLAEACHLIPGRRRALVFRPCSPPAPCAVGSGPWHEPTTRPSSPIRPSPAAFIDWTIR